MNITIQLDETFQKKVAQRIEQLQAKRVRELREADQTELAASVAESEPDSATYVKNLIRQDLSE
jgi:5,10-methylene-tetrahydrofolate dehydrogenase/methenyl tetrahydrofolate cyclohydrolase